ncbi:kinase-like protein [Auriscalpium vulgare]|uniref:Kinase-like protein n=1 Tax=Auriscalpium vulgare TaxID=40419 RepID=A0ACB8RB80_9AGAM|nr:kinase-like protein [Auriscalpium vulgare]
MSAPPSPSTGSSTPSMVDFYLPSMQKDHTKLKLQQLRDKIALRRSGALHTPHSTIQPGAIGRLGISSADSKLNRQSQVRLKSGSILMRMWRLLPSSCRMSAYNILRLIGDKLYNPQDADPTAHRLPFNLYCKSSGVTQSEIIAMVLVAENTDIPVPRVLDVIENDDELFVLMTRLPGVPCSGLMSEMDQSSREGVKNDLRCWLAQLRRLPVPPHAKVSDCLGGGSMQHRIASTPIGPFPSVSDVHEYILSHVWGPHRDEVLDVARLLSYSKTHRLCFTHGDLRPWNVLYHNGHLSGLVDFGSAGWFPEYWEHATATFCTSPWWKSMFFELFPEYEDEIDVEDLVFSVPSTHPEMW